MTGSRATTPDPLARCFGGAPNFEQAWQVAPVLGRDGSGTGFADLLSIDCIDRLLTERDLRHPAFRLVHGGKTVPRASYTTSRRWGTTSYDGVVDPSRVAVELSQGATLVLQSLHTWWAPLGRFCAGLHDALGHPTQANAYLTPPAERGLDLHYDTHDVIVLQVDGSKRWEIYEPRFERPLGSQHWADVAAEGEELDDGELEPVLDTTLGPGDCLYLPRGFVHRAVSEHASSLHVTVGIHVQTWHHVLRDLLGPAAEDPEVRGALPPEVLRGDEPADPATVERQVKALLGRIDLDRRVRRLGRSTFVEYAGHHRGIVAEVVSPGPVDDGLLVERPPGCHAELDVIDGRCVLRLADRVLRLPEAARPALEAVLDADVPFALGTLAPHLDAASRIVVGRRLLREGVLRRARPGG